MGLFAKIKTKSRSRFPQKPQTSILDVWQGSEYASELASKFKDVWVLNQFEDQR